MSQVKDRKAETVAKSAIVRLFGEDAIDQIDVQATEDQAGEPGLFVTIFLKTPQETISGAPLLDTIAEISEGLRGIEDFRFPYVTFLAPGYEHAEDTRPAA
jgi:hypothetical protein